VKENFKKICLKLFDIISFPFSFLYLPVIRQFKRFGMHHFRLNLFSFRAFGIFPIRDHYYEPQFKFSKDFDPQKKRKLPLDFNIPRQLDNLKALDRKHELLSLPKEKTGDAIAYYLANGSFEEGDADLYYLMIRNLKPRKIIEIGSGFSTLLALEAIRKNALEGHTTELFCIEPYEWNWLNNIKEITLIRKKVEEMDPVFFDMLEEGDFLFIDSSHIIRPENDVLFEYFEILPALKKGVIIHIHDIFSPRHYLKSWVLDEYRFWNEQYLLEAFLCYNDSFEIVFSLNYLKNDYYDEVAPVLTNTTPASNPASFWLRKTR
jgi:predicted O-methyltransferase YrrM